MKQSIMGIKCGQVNMASFAAGMEELRALIDRIDINVIMVQETYYRPVSHWSGRRVFYGAKADEDVSTLIVVKSQEISAVLNTVVSSFKCRVVELETSDGQILVTINS